jgi:hypothetical protein
MSKRRSKQDRIRAKHRLIDASTLSVPGETLGKTSGEIKAINIGPNQQPAKASSKNYLREIFAYDPQLIIKDLKKTFFVTLVILVILLIITLIYT